MAVASDSQSLCAQIPYYIGALFVVYCVVRLLLSLYRGICGHFLRPTINFKSFGSWAVVTGATDGIGKAYAEQLAKSGMNIMLLSRSMEKLKAVAADIQSQYHVQTKCIAADYTKTDIYEAISADLKTLDIGVLVNNVGMGFEHPEFFSNLAIDTIKDMVNVNMMSVAMMTRIVIPALLEKHKGVIINVSSATAALPPALFSVYAASKAFVTSFSEALEYECRGTGVIVQNIAPFYVATKLSKERPRFTVPTATRYVQEALKTVGHLAATHGAVIHDVQGYVISLIPRCILSMVTFSVLKGLRARVLKKKQQKAAESKKE